MMGNKVCPVTYNILSESCPKVSLGLRLHHFMFVSQEHLKVNFLLIAIFKNKYKSSSEDFECSNERN